MVSWVWNWPFCILFFQYFFNFYSKVWLQGQINWRQPVTVLRAALEWRTRQETVGATVAGSNQASEARRDLRLTTSPAPMNPKTLPHPPDYHQRRSAMFRSQWTSTLTTRTVTLSALDVATSRVWCTELVTITERGTYTGSGPQNRSENRVSLEREKKCPERTTFEKQRNIKWIFEVLKRKVALW